MGGTAIAFSGGVGVGIYVAKPPPPLLRQTTPTTMLTPQRTTTTASVILTHSEDVPRYRKLFDFFQTSLVKTFLTKGTPYDPLELLAIYTMVPNTKIAETLEVFPEYVVHPEVWSPSRHCNRFLHLSTHRCPDRSVRTALCEKALSMGHVTADRHTETTIQDLLVEHFDHYIRAIKVLATMSVQIETINTALFGGGWLRVHRSHHSNTTTLHPYMKYDTFVRPPLRRYSELFILYEHYGLGIQQTGGADRSSPTQIALRNPDALIEQATKYINNAGLALARLRALGIFSIVVDHHPVSLPGGGEEHPDDEDDKETNTAADPSVAYDK